MSKVCISIDTEYSTHKDDLGVFGKLNGTAYGVPKFMELLDEHGFKATFFVDVYTEKKEYVPAFKDICRELAEKRHDVQLHTHPNGAFDKNRIAMKDYSKEEQVDIIKKGKELFEDWLGQTPSIHRAGDWGANYDTLEALRKNDIHIDSSMFYGWENCKLNEPPLTQNRMVETDGLLEIPATVFECASMNLFAPYRLLSTDGNSFEETWAIIQTLAMQGQPVINLVYHSFSFLKWNKERTEYAVSHNRLNKFKRLFKQLSDSEHTEVQTLNQISESYYIEKAQYQTSEDVIPKTGMGASFMRLADRVKG